MMKKNHHYGHFGLLPQLLISFVSLLLLLSSSTAVAEARRLPDFKAPANTSPLCQSFASLSLTSLTPDGLEGSLFTNFAWVGDKAVCAAGGSFDSGWLTVNDPDALAVSALPGTDLGAWEVNTAVQVRKTAAVASSTGAISLAVEFKFGLKTTASSDASNTMAVTGSISVKLPVVPQDIAGGRFMLGSVVAPLWRGTLRGTSAAGNLLLSDSDLFDGAEGAFITQSSASLDPKLVDTASSVLKYAGVVSGRLKNFETIPSAIMSDVSTRLAFPSAPDVFNLLTTPGCMIQAANELLAQPSYECNGAAQCGQLIVESIKEIAVADVSDLCPSPVVDDASVRSFLTTDLSVNSLTGLTILRGLRAVTQGIVNCGPSVGSVGVVLQVVTDSSSRFLSWPTKLFLTDPKAAVQMSKSVSLIPSGYRVGLITSASDDALRTSSSGDLFLHGRGGRFALDQQISSDFADRFRSALAEFGRTLHTGVPSLDYAVLKALDYTHADVILTNYLTQTTRPTVKGLWEFWGKTNKGISIVPAEQGFVMSAKVSLVLRSVEFDLNSTAADPATPACNQALAALSKDVLTLCSACNLPVPSISGSGAEIYYGYVDGSVSASFTINALDGTVVVEKALDMWAKATITAKWQASSLVKKAEMMYWYKQSRPAIIKHAVLDSSVTGVTLNVARGATGGLIQDVAWSRDTVVGIAKQAKQVSRQINIQEQSTLDTFAKLSDTSMTSFSGLISAMSTYLESLLGEQQKSLSAISVPVSSGMTQFADSLYTEPMVWDFCVMPDVDPETLRVVLDLQSPRNFLLNVEGTWTPVIPLNRIKFRVPTVVHLEFTISATGGLLHSFTRTGTGKATDFSLPVRDQMRSGLILDGDGSMKLNLPTLAVVDLSMAGHMHRGDQIQVKFAANLTSPESEDMQNTLYKFSFEESNHGDYAQSAEPISMMLSYTDMFQYIPQLMTRQDTVLPPFNMAFRDAFSAYQQPWNDANSWAYTSPAETTLATSGQLTFPTTATTTRYNFSINEQINIDCNMAIAAAADEASLSVAVQNALKACGLDLYLAGSVSYGDEDSVQVSLSPAHPGTIYSFSLTAPASALWTSVNYQAPHSLAVLSISDMYKSVYSTVLNKFNSYAMPVYSQVPASQVGAGGIIDPSRAKFYPENLPAVMFNVELSDKWLDKRVPLATSFKALDGAVTFHTNDDAALSVTAEAHFKTQFGFSFLCSQGEGNLNLSTTFGSEAGTTQADAVVPDFPNNTFEFTVVAEKRLASQRNAKPEVFTWSKVVQLKPGNLVASDLAAIFFRQQLDPMLQRMLKVEPRGQSVAYTDGPQLMLSVWPTQTDDDTLYVPLKMIISKSHVPGVGDLESKMDMVAKAFTSCAIVKDFDLGMSLKATSTTPVAMTGSLGIVTLSASAFAEASQSFSLKGSATYMPPAALLFSMLSPDYLDVDFATTADLSAQLTIDQITLGVAVAGLSDINLAKISMSLHDQMLMSKVTGWKPVWTFDINGAGTDTLDTLKSLASSGSTTLCKLLDSSSSAVTNFVNDNAAKGSLPFVKEKFGNIFEKIILYKFQEAMSSTCDRVAQQQTLADFCETLGSTFGVEACTQITLGNHALSIQLNIAATPLSIETGFYFDTARFTKGKLAPGMGSSGDLSIMATATAAVGLTVTLGKSGINVQLNPETTNFDLTLGMDGGARLKASFGSTQVNLASGKLQLNGQISGRLSSAGSDGITTTVTGNALLSADVDFRPVYSCHLDVNIPSLPDFIRNPSGEVQFSDRCSTGHRFIDDLSKALDTQNLATFFSQDPSLFWKQFRDNIEEQMFKQLDKLLAAKIGFIERAIQRAVRKALNDIDGPEVAQQVSMDVSKMVTDLITTGKGPNSTQVEQVVLTIFTGILNKRWAKVLMEPIPVPQAGTGSYKWQLRFGKVTTYPIKGLFFNLGSHGPAGLSADCPLELVLTWSASFDLTFSKEKGMTVSFPVSPAFSTEVALNSGMCRVRGHILVVGAILDINAGLSAKISVASENNKLRPLEFNVNAQMAGNVQLGLVGLIKDQTATNPTDSLPALPYVKAGIEAGWAMNLVSGQPTTTPKYWRYLNPQLCIGSLIAKPLHAVAAQIDKVLRPLEPIFGRNGVLLKPLPGLSFISKDLNVLGVVKILCKIGGRCDVASVERAIQVFVKVSDTIAQIRKFTTWLSNSDGCADVAIVFKTFGIDWNQPKPAPLPTIAGDTIEDLANDEGSIEWGPDLSPAARPEVAGAVNGWKKTGEFGITCPILNNFPSKVVQIMLGGSVPLVQMTFPSATFSYSRGWEIQVWPWPIVTVGVSVSCSLVVAPPPVALLSDSFATAIRTKNAGALFTGLALSTQLDNGQPRWAIQGSITLTGTGSVGVGVFFAKIAAYADVFITFTASARPVNIDGGPWVTFSQLAIQAKKYGFGGTCDVQLKLTAGFRLSIRACIKIWRWKKCWTIASKTWTFPLWQWNSKATRIMGLASSASTINGDSVGFNPNPGQVSKDIDGIPTYYFSQASGGATQASLKSYSDSISSPQLSRAMDAGGAISFTGNPCARPAAIVVAGPISRQLVVPGCAGMQVELQQAEHATTSFSMDQSSIIPSGQPAVSFSGACQSVTLSEPNPSGQYSISGLPHCPVEIQTGISANVDLSGAPQRFATPLTISGSASSLTSSVTCKKMTVTNGQITCTDGLTVNLPASLASMQTSLDPLNEVAYDIMGVPTGRDVQLVGSPKGAVYTIPDMYTLMGSTKLVGISGSNNYMAVDMRTQPGVNMDVTLSPYVLHASDSARGPRMMQHANVNFRTYNVYGASSARTSTTVLPPDDFDVVRINSVGGGAAGAMQHMITGCATRGQVNVRTTGAGEHTVIIGNLGDLQDTLCTISVQADANTLTTILINSTVDDRKLRWEFSKGSFIITSEDHPLTVFISGVARVVAMIGSGSNEIIVKEGTAGTEMFFQYPSSLSNTGSSLRVITSTNAILATGNVGTLHIGNFAPTDPAATGTLPFANVQGLVSVIGVAKISMASAVGAKAQTHVFTMDDNCINIAGPSPATPSNWMLGLMKSSGLGFYSASCNLIYRSATGPSGMSLEITTGGAGDSFTGSKVVIPVSMNLGEGANRVSWTESADVPCNIVFGRAADTLTAENTGPVTVDLGDDSMIDTITLNYNKQEPSIHADRTISPCGPFADSVMAVKNWKAQDIVSIIYSP